MIKCSEQELYILHRADSQQHPLRAVISCHAVCGPVQVKVGVKDNQTTNTQVTAIMRDVGL